MEQLPGAISELAVRLWPLPGPADSDEDHEKAISIHYLSDRLH